MKHDNRIPLARQIPGGGKRGKPITDDSETFAFAGDGKRTGLTLCSLRAPGFQTTDSKRSAQFLAKAGRFAGMIAYQREKSGERQMPLQQATGGSSPGGNGLHKGPHIHLQRTGRSAQRHFLLYAAAFPNAQLILFHENSPLPACSEKCTATRNRTQGAAPPMPPLNTFAGKKHGRSP